MVASKMTRALKSGLVLTLFALCVCSFSIAHKLRESAPAPVPRDLFAVVNKQLAEFRSSNFQSAYRCSATSVQHRFTFGQFEQMVRANYPEMVQAERVEYGVVKSQGGSALVQVFFFGADDSMRSFLYSLIKEEDSWKIEGVEEVSGYRMGSRLAGLHA